MEKKQFLEFCKSEFIRRGFIKVKNMFYLVGADLLCGINLQKSNYDNSYYINFCYFIGNYIDSTVFPLYSSSDIQGRFEIESKSHTFKGVSFMTSMIKYEEYSDVELQSFFEYEFEKKVLPPIYQGKKYILNNLNKQYFLTLKQEEVMCKLRE